MNAYVDFIGAVVVGGVALAIACLAGAIEWCGDHGQAALVWLGRASRQLVRRARSVVDVLPALRVRISRRDRRKLARQARLDDRKASALAGSLRKASAQADVVGPESGRFV